MSAAGCSPSFNRSVTGSGVSREAPVRWPGGSGRMSRWLRVTCWTRAGSWLRCNGIDVAYYLVHSMGASGASRRRPAAATNFGEAARAAGVERIVYLGGLGER